LVHRASRVRRTQDDQEGLSPIQLAIRKQKKMAGARKELGNAVKGSKITAQSIWAALTAAGKVINKSASVPRAGRFFTLKKSTPYFTPTIK